jgi:hypothetical protein
MRRHLLSIALILTVTQGFAAEDNTDPVDHYEAAFPSKDGPTIKVKITSTKFTRKGHQIDEERGTVDAKRIYGVDGAPSDGTDVINLFEVTFGDKVVQVPAEQWCDCFNPTLRSPAINPTLPDYAQVGSLEIFISPDRTKVSIMMGGYRSASAPYEVIWIVQDDNHGNRFIQTLDPG